MVKYGVLCTVRASKVKGVKLAWLRGRGLVLARLKG